MHRKRDDLLEKFHNACKMLVQMGILIGQIHQKNRKKKCTNQCLYVFSLNVYLSLKVFGIIRNECDEFLKTEPVFKFEPYQELLPQKKELEWLNSHFSNEIVLPRQQITDILEVLEKVRKLLLSKLLLFLF